MKIEFPLILLVLLLANFANAEISVAVAHQKATYRWGETAPKAEKAALQACGSNCSIAMTTNKRCVAGAFPDQNGFYVVLATGATLQEAQGAAISNCERLVESCHARGYGCSDGRGGVEYIDGW
jgi:hypothetical protein